MLFSFNISHFWLPNMCFCQDNNYENTRPPDEEEKQNRQQNSQTTPPVPPPIFLLCSKGTPQIHALTQIRSFQWSRIQQNTHCITTMYIFWTEKTDDLKEELRKSSLSSWKNKPQQLRWAVTHHSMRRVLSMRKRTQRQHTAIKERPCLNHFIYTRRI